LIIKLIVIIVIVIIVIVILVIVFLVMLVVCVKKCLISFLEVEVLITVQLFHMLKNFFLQGTAHTSLLGLINTKMISNFSMF